MQAKLKSGGHFLPLPKEPAALANVLEVSPIEFLLQELTAVKNASVQRGTERGYPDIEIDGPTFGNAPHAIEIKAARRKVGKNGRASKNSACYGATIWMRRRRRSGWLRRPIAMGRS